jgi:hypothetical protein
MAFWLSLVVAFVVGFVGGFLAFPVVMFLLRDILPPGMFTPSDWDSDA